MDTFNVSFLCSPSKARKKTGLSPVEVSITVNGKRTCMKLPKFCRAEDFQGLLQSKKPNDINMYCEAVRLKINQWQTQLYLEGKTASAAKIKALLQGKQEKHETVRDCVIEYLKTRTKKTYIYAKYKNTFNRFMEFVGSDTDIADITTQQIIDYKAKYEDIYAQGTLRGEIKRVKSLFIWAFNSGIINKTPFATVSFTFKDPEQPYLTQEEIGRIRNLKLDERLDTVRNFFLFLCYSGLEFTDYIHLEKSDVKRNEQGQLYIKKQRIKTKQTYLSILYEDAAELWELFEGEIPCISCAKTNKYLKEIAEKAGITKNVTTLTARHSYATYLLSDLQIPVDIVQRMLGHASNRQSLHYAKLLDSVVFTAGRVRKKPVITETKQDREDLQRLEEAIAALKDNEGE